ncbi:MAG: cell cycle protein [Bacteroidetes bacterium 43-93]|nr:rod shape-determining protein RodA [Bacteroidota bacterium]OJW95658.1 MAG: cell cycle protein [Bacteroidetes bacterium 43-93]
MSAANKSIFSRLDAPTVLLYAALVAIGLTAVFSVEYRVTDPSIFMMSKSHMKQFTWFGISLFVGLLIIFTDSKFFSSFAYLSYTIGLFLLVITIFAGVDVKGSHSWLGVGSVRFQPGEVCKIFTSLAISKFLSSPETNFQTLRHRLIGVAIALTPAVLIILQKETGLALVYFCFFLVMYREGLPNTILIIGFSMIALTLATLLIDRWVLFGILTGLAIIVGYLIRRELRRNVLARVLLIGVWGFCMLFSQVLVPFSFKHVLQKHQVERIYTTLGQKMPEAYEKEGAKDSNKKGNVSDYNVLQSKIAIGSGGFWGKGFLNGTSTKNEFVPEQNTDFIFCAVGEQFGFAGSAVLIGIYVSLMLRLVYLAERQRSAFSRVYGYCVASILFFHFAINISMTIGLAPVIGITLPLLSYGGSSLLSFSILIFIMLRLDADRSVMIR